MKRTAVVALGGNAISPKTEKDTIANQFKNTRKSLQSVMNLIRQDYHLALTHGNGPQVGNALLRVELTIDKAPILPLGICVADTEGGMGYMIEQSLQNVLIKEQIQREVVSIITQVIVSADDPSIHNPIKFVGSWYSYDEIKELAKRFDWQIKEDGQRGWRRVVPSPIPRRIINRHAIKHLVDLGTIVIAAGGGGIPVYIMENGLYEGFDAVIDKDLAAAVLAHDIGAHELYILTEIDSVKINFGKPNEESIDLIHVPDLKRLQKEGHFPAGSMGPKIQAAIDFIESGGERVIITSVEKAVESLHGDSGTTIIV
ncbi:MAG: carbamate kinase [Candidatus Neomarinimicrobiota bacterium]